MHAIYVSYLETPWGDSMAEGKEDKCSVLWSHQYRSPKLRHSKIYGLGFIFFSSTCMWSSQSTHLHNNPFRYRILLLSHFSRVRLCATPQTAAHQAPPSLGFSRQGHWSGLPFPSPRHESEKWKWSRSVVSDPQWPHGLQPSSLLHPWDFPGKSTGVGCHCLRRQGTRWALTAWVRRYTLCPQRTSKAKYCMHKLSSWCHLQMPRTCRLFVF